MDRAEATGFGVAFAGHVALLAALSLGLATARVPPLQNDPIEVSFVEEVGRESTAPTPSAEAPAPKLAEVEGPVEPAVAPPEPQPVPLPQPRAVAPPQARPIPQPRPTPQPARPKAVQPQRPAPAQTKATPPRAAAQPKANTSRPTGRLAGLLNGVSERDSDSRATTPPARTGGPAVRASLAAELRRQLKPHWKAPTGADAEQLRTEVEIWLSQSGGVSRMEIVRTTGQTASNRPQVRLHQEQAQRAVRLAAPFRLPPDLYEAWKHVTVTFDKRLSQ